LNFTRTILVVLIATSVATLPVAGWALGAKSSDTSVSSVEMAHMDNMSASAEMSDCCPHEQAPCDKTNGNCTSMAACAGTLLSFSEPVFANFIFPVVLADVMPALASPALRSQTSSPPFRPPRV